MSDVKNYLLEKLKKEQEADQARQAELSGDEATLNLFRALSSSPQVKDSSDFIKSQRQQSQQDVSNVEQQAKMEESAAEQVRKALMGDLDKNRLDLDRQRLAQDAVKASQANQLAQDRLALDREEAVTRLGNQQAMERLKEQELAAKAAAPKEPTAGQFSAGGFAKRLEQAENVFSKLESSGSDRTGILQAAQSLAPSALRSSERQQQDQAETNFLNAILRRESGAAISDSERASGEQQYFPRLGDSPEVKEQKRLNRQQALLSLQAESGGALDKIPSASTASKDAPLSPEERQRLEMLRAKRGR